MRLERYILEVEMSKDQYEQAVLDLRYTLKCLKITMNDTAEDAEEKAKKDQKIVTLQKKIMSLKERLKGMTTSEDVKDLIDNTPDFDTDKLDKLQKQIQDKLLRFKATRG